MRPLTNIVKVTAIFLMGAILMAHTSGHDQTNIRAQQYAFKAAFLFRFIEYIEWKNNPEPETFKFSVLGKSPITEQMRIIAKDQKVKNKKMTIKEYDNLDQIGFCHILFVPENSPIPLATIISKYAGKPVLIVTEELNQKESGFHINFFISDSKLKFEINRNAVSKAGIKISSQLLQHAILVDE